MSDLTEKRIRIYTDNHQVAERARRHEKAGVYAERARSHPQQELVPKEQLLVPLCATW
jgi:hypothetical protein